MENVTEAAAVAEYEAALDAEAAEWEESLLRALREYDAAQAEGEYAQQYPLAAEHIGKALDALERASKAELSRELIHVRAGIGKQLRTAKSARAFKTLPRRAELEAAVRAMLDRAHAAGGEAIHDEIPSAYAAASFTPSAAVKWLREAAFWITDVLADDLLGAAQRILTRGLKNGTATSELMRELFEEFVPYLGGEVGGEVVTAHRLETIVRTNTTTAYNHGRLTAMLGADVARFVDGVRYSAILDERTTEVCRFLDGKVFRLPAQAADVESLLPPRHFNCRSVVVPIVVGSPIDPATVITAAEIAKAKTLSTAGFAERPAARSVNNA